MKKLKHIFKLVAFVYLIAVFIYGLWKLPQNGHTLFTILLLIITALVAIPYLSMVVYHQYVINKAYKFTIINTLAALMMTIGLLSVLYYVPLGFSGEILIINGEYFDKTAQVYASSFTASIGVLVFMVSKAFEHAIYTPHKIT